MFDENFTFDPTRSPSLDSSNASSTLDSSRSVSPCSPTEAFQSHYSVTDLASQFDRQRIRQDAQICYQPCDSYANTTDDDAAWAIPSAEDDDFSLNEPTRVRTAPARSHSPSRRLQRQTQTRMLCTGSHSKDISALLEGMIGSSEQCSITTRPSSREDEDEGSDCTADSDAAGSRHLSAVHSRRTMEYRRASDLNKTGASISKSIRFRSRDRPHRRQRSGEKAQRSA